MSTSFFEHQEQARKRTRWLVVLFGLAVLGIGATLYLVARLIYLNGGESAPPGASWWDPEWFAWIVGATAVFVGLASGFRTLTLRSGGSAVAEMLGGRPVSPETRDPLEKRLRNVVEEMAIASGVPVPAIYVLEEEEGINAFAAGFRPEDAAVAVTRGALQTLSRDELQGVIAHEFSHILNGDMRLNIRLMGVIFGILAMAVVGRFMVQFAGRTRVRSSKKDGNAAAAIVLMGLVLMIVGYIGVFVGRIIQAAISRQREYLADASAVQFTRNPFGIAGALKRIAGFVHGSRLQAPRSIEVGHFLFGEGQRSWLGGLLATHPPLEERIRRLDPGFAPEAAAASVPPSMASAPSGAAGFSDGRIAVQPQAVMARVGAPSADHVAQGVAMRSRLEGELEEDLHRPVGAAALVLALLMDRQDPEVLRSQREYLQRELGSEGWEAVHRWMSHLETLGPAWRLPLLDLATPALRLLDDGQRADLIRRLEALAAADRTLSLFEFIVLRLVQRRLAAGPLPPGGRGRATTFDLDHLLAGVSLYGESGEDLEALAAASGRPVERLREALARVRTEGLPLLGQVLDRLARASFETRRMALDRLTRLVLADGRVTLREAELTRLVAVSLDCPLPPFLEAA